MTRTHLLYSRFSTHILNILLSNIILIDDMHVSTSPNVLGFPKILPNMAGVDRKVG